jgi:hypothetical protein
MRNSELLPNWSVTNRQLETEIVVAKHRLAESGLFDDISLARIIDAHPTADLGVSTMGTDVTSPQDWRSGSAGSLSGEELLHAVRNGRLWLNLRRCVQNHPEIACLVREIYAELEEKTQGLRTFNYSANLLISSPNAIVYYHMDCPVNMLWHLRGEKRVYAYPREEKFLPRKLTEDVIAGTAPEEIPFDLAWDEEAFIRPLHAGEMITWPQHSPHRVVNTNGLNVSLSTEHYTKTALRRNNVHMANRHFRQWLPAFGRSDAMSGTVPAIKEMALRFCRRVPGLRPQEPNGYEYPKTFAVDLDAPQCIDVSDGTINNRSMPEEIACSV